MKFITSALIIAALAFGCSTAPPTAPKVPETRNIIAIDNTAWSLDIPKDWTIVTNMNQTLEVGGQELFALHAWGVDSFIGVSVSTIPLSDADENFSTAVVLASIEAGGKVTSLNPTTVLGNTGSVSTVVYPADGIMIMQVAVANKRTGYITACGGNVKDEKAINTQCSNILNTFRLKK